LLFAAVFFLGRAVRAGQPDMTPFVRTSLLFCGILMLALCIGGVITAVGLFRLRLWARVSILVFSGMVAAIFAFSAGMMLIAPLPEPANAGALTVAVRAGIACFYGLFALLGVSWLYFFSRKNVKAQFAPAKSSRPLCISIIAGFFLFSGTGQLIFGFLPFPANLFGHMVGGALGHLLYVTYGGIALGLGAGLLGLKPLARVIAVGYCAFCVISGLLFVVLPGYAQRLQVSLAVLPAEIRSVQPSEYARTEVVWILVGILICAVPIWFLVTRREAFLTSNE
jgi:hypothetical protein